MIDGLDCKTMQQIIANDPRNPVQNWTAKFASRFRPAGAVDSAQPSG
jgi:hypothetical protein